MSYELPTLMLPAVTAAADLSGKQFYAVKLDSSGDIALSTTAGEKAIGILQNEPTASGRDAAVMFLGISKAIAGGTVVPNDPVGPDGSGKLIKLDEEDEAVLGRCMVGAVADEIFPLAITHEGSAASVSDVHALTASANYSVTGQNLMMKVHTTDGEFVKCSVAGENVLGVLTNAPASGATGLIKTNGPATVTAGAGGVTGGDLLATDANGKLVTAAAGDVVAGVALAVILADATGLAFLLPSFIQSVVGTSLTATNIWVGTAGGVAAEVAMSQDVTLSNTGVATIANDAVSAAKMGSTVAGSDGAIFKSTSTPDAVTELDVPQGNLVVGTSGDVGLVDLGAAAGNILVDDGTDPVSVAVSQDATLAASGALSVSDLTIASEAQGDLLRRGAAAWERVAAATGGQILVGDGTDIASVAVSQDATLAAGGALSVVDLTIASEAQGDLLARGAASWARLPAATSGQIIVGDGTDPASVVMSGDATIAAGGAVTLANTFIRESITNWNAAEVIAGNATPLVLVDFSAEITAGRVSSGDVLIFHHVIGNINGGSINYDQNENSIIKYQTAGGGATVSLTLANWINGAGADSLTDIKQLATVVVPDADEDLVWTMSASPKNANGDRLLRVACYWSVFTPA